MDCEARACQSNPYAFPQPLNRLAVLSRQLRSQAEKTVCNLWSTDGSFLGEGIPNVELLSLPDPPTTTIFVTTN